MSQSEGNPQQLMTPSDLAARWRCAVSTALRVVRERSVPFVWVGRGAPRLTGPGRMMIRFDPAAIEAWERATMVRWEPAEEGPAVVRVKVQGLLRGQRARVKD